MSFIRKLLLLGFALGFAFVISSCNDQKKKKCNLATVEYTAKEKQELRQHRRW